MTPTTKARTRLMEWSHVGRPTPTDEPYRFQSDVRAALREAAQQERERWEPILREVIEAGRVFLDQPDRWAAARRAADAILAEPNDD